MPKKKINKCKQFIIHTYANLLWKMHALDPASKIIQAMAEFTCHNLNGSIEWAINKLFCDCEYS